MQKIFHNNIEEERTKATTKKSLLLFLLATTLPYQTPSTTYTEMAAMHQGRTEESESAPKESMSATRVCVKNLPPSFDEIKLKKHLQSSSKDPLVLTDCKILKTKDGRSRKIAFVGFKTPEVSFPFLIVEEIMSYIPSFSFDQCSCRVNYLLKLFSLDGAKRRVLFR